MKNTKQRIELDWTKLLGFNQVRSLHTPAGGKATRGDVGAEVGVKDGS